MLEGIEKASLTWRTLQDWIDKEIETMHTQNEDANLTAEATLALRTRIFTLREIAALTDPPKPPTAEAVAFDAR